MNQPLNLLSPGQEQIRKKEVKIPNMPSLFQNNAHAIIKNRKNQFVIDTNLPAIQEEASR